MDAANRRKPLTADERRKNDRLRELWDARSRLLGITQASAGEEMGISQGAVAHYLNGTARLGTEASLKFAKLLRVDVAQIDPDVANLARAALGYPPIGEIIEALSPQDAQLTLDFLNLQVDRSSNLFTAEKLAHYGKMIDGMRNDMARRRTASDDTAPLLDC